jgi:hypothetical protein
MGHTSWDCTVLPGQKAENRIALMGNSRKELAGLPDRQPRRVNTRYGLIPVAASATTTAATAATRPWLLGTRFVDGQRAAAQLSAIQRGDRRLRF